MVELFVSCMWSFSKVVFLIDRLEWDGFFDDVVFFELIMF